MAYTPSYIRKNFVNNAPPATNATNLNAIEDALVSLENGLQTAAADTDTNTADIATINGEISDINDLLEEMLPVDSASGNPAVITDAFGGAAKSLKLTLEPIQTGSGTPSPANPHSITGRTQSTVTRSGKNFYSKTPFLVRSGCTQSNYSVAKSDVTFTAASGFFGNSGQGTFSDQNPDRMVTVEAGKEYSVSLHLLSSAPAGLELKCYIQFFDMFGKNATSWQTSTGSSYTFTVPAGKSKVAFNCMFSNATTNTTATIGFQIEAGNTATDWEAYDGESITVQLGQTVCDGALDVTSGLLTITHALKTYTGASAENWTMSDNGKRCWIEVNDIKENLDPSYLPSIFCNEFETVTASETYAGTQGISIAANRIHVSDGTGTMTAATFKTFLSSNNMVVVYPLATPATVQLTPEEVTLLKGDNVITTDADNVDVEYSADIKLYIDKMLGTSSADTRSAKSSGTSEEETKTVEEKTVENEEAKK